MENVIVGTITSAIALVSPTLTNVDVYLEALANYRVHGFCATKALCSQTGVLSEQRVIV